VLEGMAIAGYAVGASQGFIYVRGEYPVAVKRLERAIRMAERQGVLGARIFDTPFQFRVDIRIGGGAFVCGEETALMASIEGGRGLPRPRPPYPASAGLWGKPTLINNVETYASVAPIIGRSGDWYARYGTEKSKGTKVFALAGKVRNTGLIEVPMGIPLREVIYGIGGGMQDDYPFKAVQTGGPSGGCIPAAYLDLPLDYEHLAQVGSIVGSGGMIVMDDSACMVHVARYYMEFCMHESCGKCVPCREGGTWLERILDRICDGHGAPEDLDLLYSVGESICPGSFPHAASSRLGLQAAPFPYKMTTICFVGPSAYAPIHSALTLFREEFEAKIKVRTRIPLTVVEGPPPAPVGVGGGA
jgi:bidirectional [NiFe] hydrogenase diaphorase subunit